MKAALALLALWAATPGWADEPPPWSIRLEMQVVSVPLAEGRRLVPLLRRPESFVQAEGRVHALLAGGEAELLAYPVAQALSGQKLESYAVEEWRTLAEFTPPSIPQLPPPPSLRVTPSPVEQYITFGRPPAFDTRNVGVTLEAEATVDAATGAIEINLVARRVHLDSLGPGIGANPQHVDTPRAMQPVFSAMEVQCALSLPRDSYHLLGQFIVEKPQPRIVLFLLHALAQPPPRTPP